MRLSNARRSGGVWSSRFNIDRRDHGITWGKALKDCRLGVSHEVEIGIRLEAVREPPKPATR